MRITEFHQKNNAYIFAGMGTYETHIRFPDTGNRIVVFEGRNGSGKSSITSMLHPFAYNEIDDNRDNSGFILEGKEGYKKIVYDDRIICEHFYKVQGDKRIVKSFIVVDGVQLNPNGNVSTFKELVKRYLGIYANNMTLLRLGSNVTGFLDKSYTERKVYAGQLLKEIEDYIQYSKVVSQKARDVKSLLRVTNEKIQRLGVESIEKLGKEIEASTGKLIDAKARLDGTINSLGVISGKEEEMTKALAGFSITEGDIDSRIKKYEEKIDVLETRISKVGKSGFKDVKDCENKLNELVLQIDKLKNENNSTKTIMDFKRNQRGVLYDKIKVNEDKLNKLSTNFDIEELERLIEEKQNRLKEFSYDFSNFKSEASIDDFHLCLSTCQDLEVFYIEILSKDLSLIKKTIRSIQSGVNVYAWIKKELNSVANQLSYNEFRYNNLKNKVTNCATYVMFSPYQECNKCKCPYIQYYQDLNDEKRRDKESEKINLENSILKRRQSEAEDIRDIADNIQYIKVALNSNKNTIKRCGLTDIISLENICSCLLNNNATFYNEKEITSKINILEDFREYAVLVDETATYQEQLKISLQYKDSIEDYKSIINSDRLEMMNLERDLGELELSYTETKESIERLEIEEADLRYTVLPALSSADQLGSELVALRGEYKQILDTKESLALLLCERERTQRDKYRITVEVDQLENNLNRLVYLKKDYNSFNRDKERLQEQYDELNTVREAVSTERGLPLYFQQIYLEQARKIMNELLEIVYQGDTAIYIDNFSINEKEFRIPYIKNGQFVDDARSASQGERSFISIALSFALMNQKIDKYNIIILDEMDSTLDTENRKLFISMLETQLEMIGAEQCFIISHNEEFESYPVDVITTRTLSEYVSDKKKRGKDSRTDNVIWYKGLKG